MDQNLEANFRPKTTCKCPKVARMSDSELIQDVKAWKARQMDNMTDTQERPQNLIEGILFLQIEAIPDDGKDDQARALIAKTVPQDPQPSMSFGTYASETLRRPKNLPKGIKFWQR